jgi:ubiquinone/menaquinone biosynthesis C-methylase UbiE
VFNPFPGDKGFRPICRNAMPSKRYKAIAEYYDPENAHHAMLEQDVPFFMGQLPKRPQSILEMAVGTGRAAIPLAQAGHRVVGVDYAADMLAIARRKRDAVGLTDRQLSLIKGDLLKLDLGRRFDWACILFNTFLAFTSIEQQDAVLQSALRHLKPRGRLWIDIFQPDFKLLARSSLAKVDPVAFYVPPYDRTVMKTIDVRRGSTPQVQRVTFHYVWFDEKGHEHRERTEFDMAYVFPRELELLIERNGLRIEHLFGNYDGSPLWPESPRIIARCCRG